MTRLRRLAKDYERLSKTLVGLHPVVFACIMLTPHFGVSVLHIIRCALHEGNSRA